MAVREDGVLRDLDAVDLADAFYGVGDPILRRRLLALLRSLGTSS
jgi:hypothetical protein